MNIMNLGGVHDNGEPKLQIGMSKNNGFVIQYDSSLGMITLTDATTGAVLPVLAPSAFFSERITISLPRKCSIA